MHESTVGGRLRAVSPVPSTGSRPRLALRLLHVNAGLVVFGFSLACMLRSGVGLGPWDVFHEGVAARTPLSVGTVIVVTGLALLVVAALAARVRPGLGSVLNMLLVGPWVDLFLGSRLVPSPETWLASATLFAVGLALNGLATGLYLTAGLGAGPRDGFVLGMARALGTTVARARTLIELTVLLVGWLLGGTVGVGTLVFAATIGQLMQASLRLCAPLARAYGAPR
jgi:uncharacterized membrane protein YczE